MSIRVTIRIPNYSLIYLQGIGNNETVIDSNNNNIIIY